MLRNTKKRIDFVCAGTLGVSSSAGLAEMVNAGYRYFDTATAYKGVNALLGEVLKSKNRHDFHLCVKINDNDLLQNEFSVRKILDNLLSDLGTDYLDTLMLNSPALLLHDHAVSVFEEMIKLKEQGKIKHIGVSNFSVKDLERLDRAYQRHISYNQIELNPYCQQHDVVSYCGRLGIQVMAYRPFGKGKAEDMLVNPALIEIGNRHQLSVHQVILAWLTQRSIVAIPKAASRQHMDANLKACDVFLDAEEMNLIATLDKKLHTCGWEEFVKLPNYKAFMDVPLVRPASAAKRVNLFSSNSSISVEEAYTSPSVIKK